VERDGHALLLDLAVPEAASIAERRPLLVLIHGGAWRKGSRAGKVEELRGWARRGYVAAAIDYRLAPEWTFPAPLEDLRAAVCWLVERADRYGIDPRRIGLIGHSAGAHLAALVALGGGTGDAAASDFPAIGLVIDFYGPTDLTVPGVAENRSVRQFLGVSPEVDPERYARASPLHALVAAPRPLPRFLIFHGTADRVVPVAQSRSFSAALRAAGAMVELHLFEGEGHGFSAARREETARRVREYIADAFDRDDAEAGSSG